MTLIYAQHPDQLNTFLLTETRTPNDIVSFKIHPWLTRMCLSPLDHDRTGPGEALVFVSNTGKALRLSLKVGLSLATKCLAGKGPGTGANGRGRTDDLRFTKPLLCH